MGMGMAMEMGIVMDIGMGMVKGICMDMDMGIGIESMLGTLGRPWPCRVLTPAPGPGNAGAPPV